MYEALTVTESGYIVRGNFKGQENTILFQSPLKSDLNHFLNQHRLCVDLEDASKETEDVRDIAGKTLLGYFRFYFRDGAWSWRWFLENGEPDSRDCLGVDNIFAYLKQNYPKGCDYFMEEDFKEKFPTWGSQNRYLVKPIGSTNYYLMVDTTYGNGDYPVRVYVYSKKKENEKGT